MSILDSNFHLSEFWIYKNIYIYIYKENSPKNVFYRLWRAHVLTSRNSESSMTISNPVPCYIPCWEGKYFSGNLMIFTDVQLILIKKFVLASIQVWNRYLPLVRGRDMLTPFLKQLIQLTVEDNYLGHFLGQLTVAILRRRI